MSASAELIRLVHKHARRRQPPDRPFVLKSGLTSPCYLDVRNLCLTPEGLCEVVWELYETIMYSFPSGIGDKHFDAVGGPSLGADPIVGALLYRFKTMGYHIDPVGFLVRPESKDHGLAGRLVGPVQPGHRCVVVEDVTTTGSSTLDAVAVLRDFGCTVLHVFAIVDRLQGAAGRFAAEGIPFTPLLTVRDLGLRDG